MSAAFYTVKEAAVLLTRSERTIWRYLRDGLPHVKDKHGQVLISEKTLRSLAQNLTTGLTFDALTLLTTTPTLPLTRSVATATPSDMPLTLPLTRNVPRAQKRSHRTFVPLTSTLTDLCHDEPPDDGVSVGSDIDINTTSDSTDMSASFPVVHVRPLTPKKSIRPPRPPRQTEPEQPFEPIDALTQLEHELQLPATYDQRVRWVLAHVPVVKQDIEQWKGYSAVTAWPAMEDAFVALRSMGYTPHPCRSRRCACYRLLSEVSVDAEDGLLIR